MRQNQEQVCGRLNWRNMLIGFGGRITFDLQPHVILPPKPTYRFSAKLIYHSHGLGSNRIDLQNYLLRSYHNNHFLIMESSVRFSFTYRQVKCLHVEMTWLHVDIMYLPAEVKLFRVEVMCQCHWTMRYLYF